MGSKTFKMYVIPYFDLKKKKGENCFDSTDAESIGIPDYQKDSWYTRMYLPAKDYPPEN